MADARDLRMLDTWLQTSAMVHRVRLSPEPHATSASLDDLVTSKKHDAFAPHYAFWAADNAAMTRRFDEASKRYLEVASRFGKAQLFGTPWAVPALVGAADAQLRLFSLDSALKAYQRLVDEHSKIRPASDTYLDMAVAAENGGKLEDAAALYEQAVKAAGKGTGATRAGSWAGRSLERLRSSRTWFRPTFDGLARELAVALRAGNAKALGSLLSPTHCQLGFLASEARFVDAAALLAQLRAALKGREARVDASAVEGEGRKFRLAVDGLDDGLFGRAVLLISRSVHGFEWTGMGILPPDLRNDEAVARVRALAKRRRDDEGGNFPGDDGGESPGPDEPPPPPSPFYETVGQLAPKCPFPAGLNLRAGSGHFIAEQAAIAAAAIAAGPFYLLALTAGAFAASLASPCGFGPGGLYYGSGWTHDLDEWFAIDFARYNPGVPFSNAPTRSTPVLAVQEGVVRFRRDTVANGTDDGDGQGNEVRLAHIRAAALPSILSSIATTNTDSRWRYTSFYLHLMGPGAVLVSPGMFVRQGALLGFMDNTGTSISDHLHFSLHDSTKPYTGAGSGFFSEFGMSVRPSPMDGQSLEDWDDGRCIRSSNVQVP